MNVCGEQNLPKMVGDLFISQFNMVVDTNWSEMWFDKGRKAIQNWYKVHNINTCTSYAYQKR